MNDDNAQLWKAYHADRSVENRNALAVAYLPVVQNVAYAIREKMPTWADLTTADLVNYGVIGLFEAIERFEPERGLKFASYSVRRIHGAIVDGIREVDWAPRLERIRDKQAGESKAKGMFVMSQGFAHERTNGVTEELLQPEARLCQRTIDRDLRDTLRIVLRGLSRDERLLMIGYYVEGQSMKEVGASLGLTESRISQLHARLMSNIRARFPGGPSSVADDRGVGLRDAPPIEKRARFKSPKSRRESSNNGSADNRAVGFRPKAAMRQSSALSTKPPQVEKTDAPAVLPMRKPEAPVEQSPQIRTLKEVERDAILMAMQHFRGKVSRAAKALGINGDTLRAKLERHELSHLRKRNRRRMTAT